MVLHFNVTKDKRKAMVQTIEKEIGGKAKYLGVPSCAYEIGSFAVGKNGELEFGDFDDLDEVAQIVDACVLATGVSPAEWNNNEKGAEEPDSEPNKGAETGESLGLTVSIPLEKVEVGNLASILDAKGDLIKKALGITNLRFTTDEENISFPWFEEVKPEEALAYTKFISAICEMSKKQKRVTAKPKENENEKYAFRCFLLRLGFIGDEFKADRKILLSKLDGLAAFNAGAKKGGRAIMFFPPRDIVNKVKEQYPAGSRVELISMNDSYRDIPSGTKGTVTEVDDTGTIHVHWDNGCCLGVVYGEDSCRKLNTVKGICYNDEEVWDSREDALEFYMKAMAGSEGSEHSRYAKIVSELAMGLPVCTDEEE